MAPLDVSSELVVHDESVEAPRQARRLRQYLARRAAGDIEGRIHGRFEEPVLTERGSRRLEHRA